jgi:transcriptional regulator with XRE-family HTH domain
VSPRRLGMKIKRLRTDKGLTQATLAAKARISRVHLANVESADNAPHHRSPSLAVLERLAKALGVPLTELLE